MATEFILIILTAVFGGMNFPLCKTFLPIHKWEDTLIWITLGFNDSKMFDFYLWREILAGSWS